MGHKAVSTTPKEDILQFERFEVNGVKDLGDEDCMVVEDAEADFFSLYGRTPDGLAYCIGDFSSREVAESIRAAIESHNR